MVINVLKKEMIMKKTYLSPNTKKVALRTHHMLCISGGEGMSNGGNASDYGIRSAGSRGNSFWDDEE